MKTVYFGIILLTFSLHCFGQNKRTCDVIESVLYEKSVYKLVFFYYDSVARKLNPYAPPLPDGMTAVIVPNYVLRQHYDSLTEKISNSLPHENKLLTFTLVRRPEGTVHVSSRSGDRKVKMHLILNRLDIEETSALVQIVMTNEVEKDPLVKNKYFQIDCKLSFQNNEWVVKKIRLKAIPFKRKEVLLGLIPTIRTG
jgi:hypothetical protein